MTEVFRIQNPGDRQPARHSGGNREARGAESNVGERIGQLFVVHPLSPAASAARDAKVAVESIALPDTPQSSAAA